MCATSPHRVERPSASVVFLAGLALSAAGCNHIASMLLDADCDSDVASGNAVAKEFAEADFGGVDYVTMDHASTSTLTCPEQARLEIHFEDSNGMQQSLYAGAQLAGRTDASVHAMICRKNNGRFEIAADDLQVTLVDRAAARAAFDDACAHYRRAR